MPRVPSEIVGGDGVDVLQGKARVVNMEGADVNSQFLRGAKQALEKVHLVVVAKF